MMGKSPINATINITSHNHLQPYSTLSALITALFDLQGPTQIFMFMQSDLVFLKATSTHVSGCNEAVACKY